MVRIHPSQPVYNKIMSKSIIDRIGADTIIQVCNTAKTFKDACAQLKCGYRYLVDAAKCLDCYDVLKQNSILYSKRRTDFSKPWFYKSDKSKNSNGYVKDYKIWCNEIFKGNVATSSSKFRNALIKAGYKENKCEICGIDSWNNKPITCQLHHIDGNTNNNSLDNIMMLCPNCHSQTDNYGSKNKKDNY